MTCKKPDAVLCKSLEAYVLRHIFCLLLQTKLSLWIIMVFCRAGSIYRNQLFSTIHTHKKLVFIKFHRRFEGENEYHKLNLRLFIKNSCSSKSLKPFLDAAMPSPFCPPFPPQTLFLLPYSPPKLQSSLAFSSVPYLLLTNFLSHTF